MTKRLEVRLPDEVDRILVMYCEESGASRTGAIIMLVKSLREKLTFDSQQLLENVNKCDIANHPLTPTIT